MAFGGWCVQCGSHTERPDMGEPKEPPYGYCGATAFIPMHDFPQWLDNLLTRVANLEAQLDRRRATDEELLRLPPSRL